MNVKCGALEIANWIYKHLRHETTAKYHLHRSSADVFFAMLKLANARGISIYRDSADSELSSLAAAVGSLEAIQ